MLALPCGVIADGRAKAALEQWVVGNGQREEDGEMHRDVGAITACGRAMPVAIVIGWEGAGGLVGGLEGREGSLRGRGWAETIALGTPCEQSLFPEGWHGRMEMRHVAVREEDRDGVVGEVGIGEADPVEHEQLIGMGCGLKQVTHGAHAEGTCEELNVKAAATTLRVVLHQDSARDMVGRGGGSRERVGAKGGGGRLNEGPGHALPAGQNSVNVRERLAFS
jgi:hypothetical protein